MSVQEQHAADTSIGSPASVTTSSYPDFTSYHQQVPDHCLPSKKNHIEQNYFITNRVSRNKTLVCNATCAFCLQSFSGFNSTKMRVHLTGEEEAQTRVAPCKRVPAACKEFYQAERDSAMTAAKKKQEKQLVSIKEAIQTASDASESRKRKASEQEGSISTRCLSAPGHLRNVTQLSVDKMIVSAYILRNIVFF